MYRPGGSPIHPSEDIFSREIAKQLPEDFIVVPNATLETGRADFDLDSTIIGPPGVVIVELKTWKGAIDVQPGRTWRRYVNSEWKSVRSPLLSLQHKQRRFHTLLFDLGLKHVSVLGVVALFGDRYQLQGRRELRRHVLPASRVAEAILARKLVFHLPNVRATTGSERLKIADLIASRPASGSPSLQGYDTGEMLDSNAKEGWFEYAGIETVTGRRVRIRIWPTKLQTADGGPALREARALSLVHSAQVIRYFCTCPDYDHDDTLITVTEDLPPTCLEGFLSPRDRPARDVARHWLRLAFVGLDACHAHGIVHRNVNPRSVRIVDRRGPVLTEFHRARVPGFATIGLTSCPPTPFVPPEFEGTLAPASERSDLYSMAAVFASLVGASAEQGIDARRRVLREEFGDRPGDVLNDYLAKDPSARPDSARALLATF
jgi:hypothetical protein